MTKNYTTDTARSSLGGYSMWEIGHTCDAQHEGHRRRLNGTCSCNGELLTGWPCDVHGPSRRMGYDEWVRKHKG